MHPVRVTFLCFVCLTLGATLALLGVLISQPVGLCSADPQPQPAGILAVLPVSTKT